MNMKILSTKKNKIFNLWNRSRDSISCSFLWSTIYLKNQVDSSIWSMIIKRSK